MISVRFGSVFGGRGLLFVCYVVAVVVIAVVVVVLCVCVCGFV